MSKQQYSRRFQVMEFTSDTEKKATVPEVPTFIEGITAALASRSACTYFNAHFSGLRLREVREGEAMPVKWCRLSDDSSGAPLVEEVHVVASDPPPRVETMVELEARAAKKSEEALAKLAPKKKGKRA